MVGICLCGLLDQPLRPRVQALHAVTARYATLTPREREICDTIGPELKKRGLIFVGIDVIGDYLTEINVTSPTGIQELERFDGTNTAERIWQVIEAKRGLEDFTPTARR